MVGEQIKSRLALSEIIEQNLKPYVKKIDQEAFYAVEYIRLLGKEGYFSSQNKDVIFQRVNLVEETAKVCMTTAFCVWCQLAAITYVTFTKNVQLRQTILPKLESGKLMAGTGLSNPLKSFADLEPLHLKATKVDGGFIINGSLPAVSNIGVDHSFAFIASLGETDKVMGFTSCNVEGISLSQRTGYIGINGSATYACKLKDVFVPESHIISYEADEFVQSVRGLFVSYQVPLGLGVMASSIAFIQQLSSGNGNLNQSLRVQPEELLVEYDSLQKRLREQIDSNCTDWNEMLKIRRDVVYSTLKAVQTLMIHHGGPAYLQTSAASRKLREAYFLVNLTPTVKHLEKLLNQ